MEEKIKERLKKLQALAERGIGGEKITAEKTTRIVKEKRHRESARTGNR